MKITHSERFLPAGKNNTMNMMTSLKNHTSLVSAGKSRSKRGISLLEGVLYLALMTSVLGFTANVILQQNERQSNILAASNLRDLTDAGQLYMSGEYSRLREELAGTAATPGNTPIEALIPLTDVADRGYFPGTLMPGGVFTDEFDQTYGILVRGVNANDGTVPQATLERSDVVDGTGSLDPDMIDGNPANGEYELEAILVSYGGDLVPQRRGGPISIGTGRATAGLLPERFPGDPDPIEAFGPNGGFQFDLTGFADDILAGEGTAFFPQPEGGRFISLLALSNYGALTAGGLVPGEGGSQDGVFLRCEQILATAGMNQNSADYIQCLNDNEIYDEIVFNNDFDPAFRSAIREVDEIAFTADGTGVIDMGGVGSEIQNLSDIHCGTASALPANLNQLRINCGVALGDFDPTLIPGFDEGDLGVAGDFRTEGNSMFDGFVRVDGIAQLNDRVDAAGEVRLTSVDGGQDVREAIFNSYRQGSDTVIAKPSCPAPMTASLITSVASYADPQGRGSVGVTSFGIDEGANWRLRLVMFLDEDVCDNAALGPYLDPTLSPAANGCLGGDGQSDSYEVPAAFGNITAQTQCVAP